MSDWRARRARLEQGTRQVGSVEQAQSPAPASAVPATLSPLAPVQESNSPVLAVKERTERASAHVATPSLSATELEDDAPSKLRDESNRRFGRFLATLPVRRCACLSQEISEQVVFLCR